MKDRAAALRYARALEAALEGDEELSRAADGLAALARGAQNDPVVMAMLTSPGVDAARKCALIDAVAGTANLAPTSVGLLKILVEHGRMGLLPQVAAAVGRMRDKRGGIVEAEVTTAAPLGADLAEKTKAVLEKATGRKVRLAMKTDPALIGGIVAKIGSTVYDGSVRARLAALRGHIARG